MGTFGGHALPGTFFILFALWWTLNIFRRYYRSLVKGGQPYMSSMTFPCDCLCSKLGNFELEGLIKIAFCLIGLTAEIITGFHDGHFAYLGNGQHATMFFFFALSGVIDILVHHRVPLPGGIQYVAFILALVVEAVLFKFHLHGRPPLDVLIHTLFLYLIYANVVMVGLEMRYSRHALASLSRAFFLFLQGTWMWQMGFMLYNPIPGAREWDTASRDLMTIATMMFAWHMAGVFILMVAIGALIGSVYRCRGDLTVVEFNRLSMKLITKDANGHTIVNLHDEELSDSDIEFEKSLQSPNRR